MSQPPQGPRPPSTSQQFGPPPWPQTPPGASAPQQWQGGIPAQQRPDGIPPQQWHQAPPLVPPGFPVVSRPPRGNGWWTASAVLAFLGAGSAVSLLGFIAVMAGFLGFFVAVMGGGEGLRQITDDFAHTTSWLFYLFLAVQLAMAVVGVWAGRNCLRGKASGAFLAMLTGALGVGVSIWLGIAVGSAGDIAVGVLGALALIVCPAIALRFPQPVRT